MTPNTTIQAVPPMVEDAVTGSGGKRIFVRRYDNEKADYVLVLVHGTAGNSESYDAFAEHMRRHYRAAVYSFDLTGHGRTEGKPGVFSFEAFLEDTRAVTDYAARRTSLPVVVHGASQGGEVAFHALDACPAVAAGVCMNILLNHEAPMSLPIRLFRSRLAKFAADKVGDRLRVPLRRFIDFKAAYQEDPGLLDTKKKDPLYVWSYGFKSYHSVFNYVPPKPAAANTKPVLIACGEHDEIVGVEHCRACFERIGGTKDFFVMPGGGHQLMLFDTSVYGRVIDSWIRERVLGKAQSWQAPIELEERSYFEFLDRERANDAAGEPEYRYSIIDRVLMRISNGTIERGVRYFSNAEVSDQWRFTAELVGEIDYAAWDFLRDYLPAANGQRPAMAVVGCGSGGAIAGLLERYPELGEWDVVGIDVDYKSIDAARKRFAGKPGVTFVVGDARNPEVLGANRFDLVYLHGVLDHCTQHRRLMDSVFRALKPGGRMFYVAPDRNLCTWLCFVTIGPLFVFGLHKPNHDFRRFPRPAELNAMLRDAGFELLPRRDRPAVPAMVGVEYKSGMNPFPVKRSVRTRALGEEIFEHTEPRWWLGNGFVGEYAGAVQKPLRNAAV
ncbi:alpha/beta fold hydrolase [Mycobacterium sp. 852002-30065_SCH5024008]|uniref:alpha/beta fold hydrolase n=1 Tax=Mycobacterium sp. 852002-30065_SCH5024008 TaxID=1834088 RepID=UPI0007FDC7AF|nr:alpha/beta fold hydrolase [Mycobacterium sp. 852002-30065_SCH5024008]OBB83732.1 lipase [Mycobacterium sp. 852002-30065_SCH5024008]